MNPLGRKPTHGQALRGHRTAEYNTWSRMIARCHGPGNRQFADYGGRGIVVCERWRASFEAFFADMGTRPPGAESIDRIDNDGPYAPGNCRWATRRQQNLNRRSVRLYTHEGITLTMPEWADRTGIPLKTIRRRHLHYGWTFSDAVIRPIDPRPWRNRK